MLAGKTIAEVGGILDGDLLGDDPIRSWDDASREALVAVRQEGALDRTVHLSYGDSPGASYVQEVATDLLIHGWDLARAVGADEAIDPELVRHVHDGVKDHVAELKATGAFGPEVAPPEGADLQTQLLAIFGRVA
jgi:uncharacterized protein (TIGR03086 family)